ILSKPTAHLHLYNTEKSFPEYPCTHFRNAFRTICEDDGYFYHLKSVFDGREFHFDLECIPDETYAIQRYGFQYFALVTNKTGRSIAYRDAGNQPYITGCEVRHQYPAHGPIHHIYALDIPGAYRHIRSFNACLAEPGKVFRIV